MRRHIRKPPFVVSANILVEYIFNVDETSLKPIFKSRYFGNGPPFSGSCFLSTTDTVRDINQFLIALEFIRKSYCDKQTYLSLHARGVFLKKEIGEWFITRSSPYHYGITHMQYTCTSIFGSFLNIVWVLVRTASETVLRSTHTV